MSLAQYFVTGPAEAHAQIPKRELRENYAKTTTRALMRIHTNRQARRDCGSALPLDSRQQAHPASN